MTPAEIDARNHFARCKFRERDSFARHFAASLAKKPDSYSLSWEQERVFWRLIWRHRGQMPQHIREMAQQRIREFRAKDLGYTITAGDPTNGQEWQEAVNIAAFLVLVEAARLYGLIAGSPGIDRERCLDILTRGRELGYLPEDPKALCERYVV